MSAALIAVFAIIGTPSAQALSCLPVDMYLKDVVGNEEVVIFVGTATDQITEDDYTAEFVRVDEAKQGYVEEQVFVYHEKDETWGYYCNQGPGEEGSQGLYVTIRDDKGTYTVTQRLALTDPLVATLEEDLQEAEVEGGTMEITKTDRINQIITTIKDLIDEIKTLMKELAYWKNQ